MLKKFKGGSTYPESRRTGEELECSSEGAGVGFVGGGGAAIIQVLEPELQVALELAQGSFKYEVD